MQRHPVRPVDIASISGPCGNTSAFLHLAEEAAAQHPDILILPENWQNTKGEAIDSPVIAQLCALAKANHCYIVHPTYLLEGGIHYNTALLIDREGKVAGRYDKIYPYWSEVLENGSARYAKNLDELQVRGIFAADSEAVPEWRADEWQGGVANAPGGELHVMTCDFGKIAILICFDANFPSIWAEAAAQGAELIIWPSAYGAGMQLAAHALNHHYAIVTSTLSGHTMAFDIDGERILNTRCTGHHTEWITLELDRCIFHENFNEFKLEALLNETPRRIEVEKHLEAEQWIIVRAAMAGVSARSVCAQAGMEELRDYKRRSKAAIDAMRKRKDKL